MTFLSFSGYDPDGVSDKDWFRASGTAMQGKHICRSDTQRLSVHRQRWQGPGTHKQKVIFAHTNNTYIQNAISFIKEMKGLFAV